MSVSSPVHGVTLHQVAAKVGVSHQTVSRVVNNSPHVAEATREAVRTAISEMGYRPNRAARHLVSKRSSLIGVVTCATESYGPARAVISIDQAVLRHGYRIVLTTLKNVSEPNLRAAAGELSAHGVEGVILNLPMEIALSSLVELLSGTPFVAMDANGQRRFASVAIDHRRGSVIATEHLINLGHRQIACLSGSLDWRCGRLRKEGWLQAVRRRGYVPGPILTVDWSAAGGYSGVRELLKNAQSRFTAIVCGNDQIALGALCGLREAGLLVPRDVSVVGFDNMPEAAYFDPGMTTVHLDFDAAATTAVNYLFQMLRSPDTAIRHIPVIPELVCRRSTERNTAR